MKRILVAMLAAVLSLQAFAQISFAPNPAMPMPENIKLYMNADTGFAGRFNFMRPYWFIWTDGPCSTEQAEALVDELGFNGPLKDYVTMIAVISPVNGKGYDAAADFEVYKSLFNKIRVFTNLKVIGIGSGATFVNECIAPVASEVAGIFCYSATRFAASRLSASSGSAASSGSVISSEVEKSPRSSTVPAYLASKDAAKAAKAYISRNSAVQVEKGKTFNVFRNAEEPLLQVLVNTKPGTLADTFADAWDKLFSVNYRCSNLGHTGYMGGTLGQYGDYELEPYLMWERLGTQRNVVEKSLFSYNKKEEKYLWYEYVPACMESAPMASVPLVILLHGHNNDPRTQAETSGFVELGASEGFMVAELEWQGKPGYDYMGDHGIEAVVRELLRKYPQLDASRVYAEGLSAGGFTATALGVAKTHLFAAVGAHSGGLFSGAMNLGFPFMNPEALKAEARQKSGKVQMPYFSITGTADDAVPFNNPSAPNGSMITGAWRLYQELNGLTVSGPTDLEKYPIFGLPLENRHRIETVKHHAMEVGDILNTAGQPVIRVVAVENFGHWNFVPGATEMWNFFKLWRRDPATGRSIYCDGGPSIVVQREGSDLYIDAVGGENPRIVTSSTEPQTLADLTERLVKFKAPMTIKARRNAWGEPLRPAEKRYSWGEVVKSDYDFAVKGGDTLRLTVWRQPGYDVPRPIMLYSFGGGWQHGARWIMDNPIFPFCTQFAELGYVVVSIDYRLGVAAAMERGDLPKGDIVELMIGKQGTPEFDRVLDVTRSACLDAVEDLYDATSFVVKHAAEWGGDPAKIVICGGSAGACNSIMAEYLRVNGDPMALAHLPEGFRYAGVVPCAGAIFTGDKPLAWKSMPAPILFFHGDIDPIVPYDGSVSKFQGPKAIIPSLPEHTPYVMYSMLGVRHEASGVPTGYMNHVIASFIERYVVQGDQSCVDVEETFSDPDHHIVQNYILNCNPYPKAQVYQAVKTYYPEYAGDAQ